MAAGEAFLTLPLERYPRRAQLAIVISNAETGQVLRRLPLAVTNPNHVRLYAQPWLDAGLRQVAVAITCYPPRGAAYTERLLLPLVAGQ